MKLYLKNSTRSMWAAFFANVIFGFSFLFTKVSLLHTTPYVLLSCRFFVALLVFSLFLLLGKTTINLKGKPWGMLFLLGIFQPVLYFVGETYGVLYTSSTFSAIMIALIPIVSLWASALFLKESPTVPQSMFCCLSVFGVILITANTASGSSQLKGVIFLLFAVFADVAFSLISRKISVTFSSFERTYMMFLVGFLVFFILMLRETHGQIAPFFLAFQSSALRWPILYLGIASSVIAFFLINYSHTHLPVTRTIVFVNVTTLISVLAGVIFLHEVLSPLSLMAAGMILIGVWGVQRFSQNATQLQESSPMEEL
jgi:drug/metabolite transporter (DMT)-like permease